MEIILAVDLMGGRVVHGYKGERSSYRPLTWGIARSADPALYVSEVGPRFLYVADLDRIMGTGSNDAVVERYGRMVERCYVDRGVHSPGEYLAVEGVTNVVGTETGGSDLWLYHGGYLSLDVKEGVVIPSGEDPVHMLQSAATWAFEGCIVLNLGAVGTESGLPMPLLAEMRSAYPGRLLYGGGVGGAEDLDMLRDLGYDGAIVATAVHRGTIPLSCVRGGAWS